MKKNFLLEINVEELPAGYVRGALDSLCSDFHLELTKLGIAFDHNLTVNLGTKNSLICYIKDMDVCQKESSKEILGPPKRIAFDDNGNPTKQAIGFAKNQGVKIEDLKIKETPKGEYVVVEKKEKARNTKDILKEITPRIIRNIYFPKTMRWDDSGLRFARPIESVLALFGKEHLDIRLGNIPSAKDLKKIKLSDSDKRKTEIKRLILRETKKLRADQCVDEALLEEITFMVNSPTVFSGEFDKKFLALPEDVLRASMAKHQRIFPVVKKDRLTNRFIAVIDGSGRNIRLVRRNYENILEAKLKDSLFFFDEDIKRSLSDNIPQLKDLIFHKDLGNMFEKIERLKVLCVFICDRLNVDSSLKKNIEKSAELSKVDLVTHMVGEFPSLQGVMGREYALRNKEEKDIALAIGEQYLPQGLEDDLPKTKQGAILAISDKIDNVVGFLGVTKEVSGSFDPFGIRRNALGLIRIVKDQSLRFEIVELVEKAIQLYGNKLKTSKEKVADYIKDRVEFLMGDIRPIELKRAVLDSGRSDIVDIFNRIEALSSVANERYFLEAAKVVERTSNILKGAKNEKISEVNKGLFKEKLEQDVWQAYLDSKDKISALIDKEEYVEATKKYAQAFYRALHDFFDNVMVNDKDRSLRLNRLAMMKAINRLYTERIADLALLPQILVR
ncbi:MAG: glycine--tRNA ligase subunit beta [Candidatus Gorgyraea atricola]|nr:glycine--tRNA ligase subunit beta [Candidatus Gorgyraea atricola]